MTKKKQGPEPTNALDATRLARGRIRSEALFPVKASNAEMPADYARTLAEIKERIKRERLRTVLAANKAMVLLYWDIGKTILERQKKEDWGAKVIDRLSGDLRQAFPDMQGFSPRNPKYMRAFADAWKTSQIVQEVLAQIPWYQNIAWVKKGDSPLY